MLTEKKSGQAVDAGSQDYASAGNNAFAFVLLFLPRTGSNMLREWLSTHESVRCLPAILAENSGWPRRDASGRAHRHRWLRENVDSKWDDSNLRREKPQRLLREILAKSHDKRAVGFKHQLAADPLTETVLGFGPKVRKVLLIRGNLLAAYSSDKVADATGQGTARTGNSILRATVEFDLREFSKFADKRASLYARAREIVRRPCLEIEYVAARTVGGVAQIGRFLDVDPSGFGAQKTIKRNSDDIVSRFSNPEAVRAYLEQNGLEHWAAEN